MAYKFKIEELEPRPLGPITLFMFRFFLGFATLMMAIAIIESDTGFLIVSIINTGLIVTILSEHDFDVQRVKEKEKKNGRVH